MWSSEYSLGSVSPVVEADIEQFSANIRSADIEELSLVSDVDPLDALRHTVGNAKLALAIRDKEGVAVSMIGINWTDESPRVGLAWFLSADVLDKYALVFLQEMKHLIGPMMQGHDMIYNFVYKKNAATMRWLEWLGFEELEEMAAPRGGNPEDKFAKMALFSSPEVRDLYVNRDWAAYVESAGIVYERDSDPK